MRDTALQTRHPARPARHSRRDGAATTQRWAVGVLAVSTVLLLGYAALLVVAAWLFASGWNVVTTGRPVSVDVLAIGSDLAPALLVGWCTGLAASAALARGEALGARTAGMVAGSLGTAAGAALLAVSGLL